MPSDKEMLDWIEKNFDRLAGNRPTKRPPPNSPFIGFYVYWGKRAGGCGSLRRAVSEQMATDGVMAVAPAADPLDRAKQIRERVAELEAEVERLVAEHETITGGPWGKVDADDIAWATGKAGVNAAHGGEK